MDMFQRIHQLNDRSYKALVGMSKEKFQELTLLFYECKQQLKQAAYQANPNPNKRKSSAGAAPKLQTPTEQLFFTLYYLKSYPSFDNLGFIFGFTGATAHENLKQFLPVLQQALKVLNVLPKRDFESPKEFLEFTKEHKNILLDATERLHHRKKNNEEQKKYYNSKKKAHTVKNTVMTTTNKAILYLSPTELGKKHDFRMLKEAFSPHEDWFKQKSVWVDLGYIGFDKNYVCESLQIPIKKPYKTKKNPNPQLTPEQKAHNKFVGSTRVRVEHAIGGIKRYNILSQKFRNKCEYLRDKVIFIASGLWNFHNNFSFS